ncbi:hypothetical protein M501DRAFT_1007199 [Patellaria atrata CBS 101060]|uniref:uS12 prolyl 3,4-dihydroxylase n=1 Tax=Patellaria atrata CBS 101060 TaxID=1346257 RepID=A0A9P4VQF1_9PEZI|nr:hypothetical protein M501DRAFT_1007199 [Patellaria atrata CBS 101060]
MKRKASEGAITNGKSKKRAISDEEAQSKFRKGLFDTKVLEQYTDSYKISEPYKHAVISNLIDDTLLRFVRDEIRNHLSFTPKETDIYRIHQSGDLANLDGLDDSSLAKLPSLLTLRDALYSTAFRKYVSHIADAGPLSGRKTDMAINVYTPGCHLLCHDDVIGSRRVSYILYLTDPDKPWRKEWGGALRLYPTETFRDEEGVEMKIPTPDFTVSIPPAWNQLSFFAVQPGESFHDVEEVYVRGEGESEEEDEGRVRMAISGWYHIPQEGEEGYEPGLEAKLAEKSSLQQLQSKTDKYDLPQPQWREIAPSTAEEQDNDDDDGEEQLTESDLEFLLRFIAPTYLTPTTVEELNDLFTEDSSLRLSSLLAPNFSTRLREFLETAERDPNIHAIGPLAPNSGIARPPHKHRFLYRHPAAPEMGATPQTPYDELVDEFFPSAQFAKWLGLVTGCTIIRTNIVARRFRRGMDYTLATAYEEEEPLLEVCLNITPSGGWGEGEDGGNGEADSDGDGYEDDDNDDAIPASEDAKAKTKDKPKDDTNPPSLGGYEVYMAADDSPSHTRQTADPAIYQSNDDGDDGVLFTSPPSWGTLNVVLRDTGVLRFVKFVSAAARGDRWDVGGEFGAPGGAHDGADEVGVAASFLVVVDDEVHAGEDGGGQSRAVVAEDLDGDDVGAVGDAEGVAGGGAGAVGAVAVAVVVVAGVEGEAFAGAAGEGVVRDVDA